MKARKLTAPTGRPVVVHLPTGGSKVTAIERDPEDDDGRDVLLSDPCDMAGPTGTRTGERAGHLGAAGGEGEAPPAAPPLEGGQREHRAIARTADSHCPPPTT